MKPTKRLRGICTVCGSSIEFPAEMIGSTAQCLRCRKQTQLLLAPPAPEPALPRKVVIWTVVTVVILVAGAVALVVGLKRLQELADRQKTQPTAVQPADPTNSPSPPRR
jgi:hypothetical protein